MDACCTGNTGLTVRFVKDFTDEKFQNKLGKSRGGGDVILPECHPLPSAVYTLGHGGWNYWDDA